MGKFSRDQRNLEGAPSHLPLPPGPVSNGEFVPAAPSAHDRAVNDLIRSSVDDSARVLGMDRRRFLQSAGAVAASLAAFELAGCASPAALKSAGAKRYGRGGTFTTPPSDDIAACQQALGGSGEFIFDVHPSRHPERALGPERPRDGRPGPVHAAARLYRRRSTRLRRPVGLPA
ncbi:MAG TPA: hypothetical protein VG298_12000 [Acidimicrobiales bacterium]|nr:hypothetical protein [Acidimicrobiales bacterium]